MDTHIKVAAWLRIIYSGMGLLVAFFILFLFGGISWLVGGSGDPDAAHAVPIIHLVGAAIAAFLGITALPGLITGWGLLTYQPWARILDIVLSALDLFHIPVGTALGAYSIWVMIQPETVELFERGRPPTRYPTHF
jgi:hypothetical protein